jgi:uncharacterized Ntn-hydrolase superfamily protein
MSFNRPISTYSIVALDRKNNQMGVAVQSHWFSVGSVVPWAESGVGVVAVQSMASPSYGVLGLSMMRQGESPRKVLDILAKQDISPGGRQVAMINVKGELAVDTGPDCLPEAGHYVGHDFSTQANLMRNDKVWKSMAESFESSEGELATRLLFALKSGQDAGGDIRGMQSAAILVVKTFPSGKSWEDKILELRVEDHPQPLKELERLMRLHKAYVHANRGDALSAMKKSAEAFVEYDLSVKMAPEVDELKFWKAVTLAANGRVNESIPIFRDAFKLNPDWKIFLKKLVNNSLYPITEEMYSKVTSVKADPQPL